MHLFDLPTPLTGRVKSLKSGRGVRTDADSEKFYPFFFVAIKNNDEILADGRSELMPCRLSAIATIS
ncbi:predicted protein [Arabidopsis lyrata subsp. lyrata]|uniref:Predicted protein n=1 Tax=Arabidopsis lyrata subsp. lyrata TaxID=81972 RepID=D7KSL1_ARALL|nr:predicted protein [Arabidopsis lyrata subsp. lyrata]